MESFHLPSDMDSEGSEEQSISDTELLKMIKTE